MIYGIGTDIIEIERIKKAISRYGDSFFFRTFTEKEQSYCLKHKENEVHFAGRFAAKEAIVKAAGTGFRDGISWLDMEILNNTEGKPEVTVSGCLKEFLDERGLKILVSISHCKNYATAFAVCELIQ